MLLARLRRELLISDERHELLRAMIEDGRELEARYDILKILGRKANLSEHFLSLSNLPSRDSVI